MAIAIDLHVSRKTVRLARERLGIPSLPPGRRPRHRIASVAAPARKPSIVKITAKRTRASDPPSSYTVLGLVGEWVKRTKTRDAAGQIDALHTLAAEAWRLADHLEQAQAA